MRWNSVQIAKTCLRTRMRDPKRNPDTPFLYVDISAIDRSLKVITSAPEILGADAPSRARKEIREGDILVSTVRPNLNAVAVVPPDLDGQIASTGFCVLRPNKETIFGKYLFYFTTTPNFVGILSGKVRGAHYPAVSDGDVKEIELPLPTVSEQQRIVEILDQANALRRKRAEADAKAARILPALFYKMFGDPVTNSRELPIKKLGDLIEEAVFGLSKPLSGKTTQEPGTIPILRMANISPEGFLDVADLRYEAIPSRSSDRYTVKRGDLLFNWRNSPKWIGKTAIFHGNGPFSYASFLYRLRVKQNQADNRYIWQLLNALVSYGWFTQKCRQAVSQANFGRDELANIDIPYAKLERQQEFGRAYDQCLLQRDLIFKSSKSIEAVFRTLLYCAFTGDLTAKWREAHMKELLAEMETQAKALDNRSKK